jgi:hypothetical protein
MVFIPVALAAAPARAAVYSYVSWTAADVPHGTASGVITLPDDSMVTVSFEAINQDGSPGTLYGAQINGTSAINYWIPSEPYISTQVENAPPSTDILQLSGGLNQTYKVTLSEPIKDPMMAIVSLGDYVNRCTYDFDSPFTIVSQGRGYWGGSDTALKALPDDILEGYEGHGTIQFIGTFSTFSWTVPTPESWHGFTFAIRTTERLEPTPSAGGAGAGGDSGSSLSDAGAANGNAAGADTSGEGGESTGGTSFIPNGSAGESEGGVPDPSSRALRREDAGCNCTLPHGSFGQSGTAAGFLLLAWLGRARLRRRR